MAIRTEYFQHQKRLLDQERQADSQSFQALALNASAAERRAKGMCWYPVAIRSTETERGDYLGLTLERTSHFDTVHNFKNGSAVALFSNHAPQEDRIEGTLKFVRNDQAYIVLRTEELPEWAREGKLGLDLMFDRYSYDEMDKALQAADQCLLADGPNIVKVLTGQQRPRPGSCSDAPDRPEGLNDSQALALQKIVLAEDLAIVHGPPGTGKTTTLVASLKAMFQQRPDGQILVTAPSNNAVDLLAEKLHEAGLKVLRLGNPVKISDTLQALGLEAQTRAHPLWKEIKKSKKRASEFQDMAHKYKRNFGKAEREQRKALFDEARKIRAEADKSEQYIMDRLIRDAQIIAATLVGSQQFPVRDRTYDVVVVDEAGQALEPAMWIALQKAPKAILAGDHCQLPPTLKANLQEKDGLGHTLLEKCTALWPEAVTMLEEQYRMHEQIMAFPSRAFYEDRLKAHGSVATRLLFEGDMPLCFIDTAGTGFEERSSGTSLYNPEEADLLVRILGQDIEAIREQRGNDGPFPSIAVISPYKAQVGLLQDKLGAAGYKKALGDKLAIDTIDGFQGQEKDIVYICMARSNTDGSIGFLSDIRRMNVAMTRARMRLVVIGDSATLGSSPFYTEWMEHVERSGGYRSAWEWAP